MNLRSIMMATGLSGLMFICAPAQAQRDWYAGGSAGVTHSDANAFDIHPNLQAENPLTTSHDSTDYGWKATLGRRLNQRFALELIYANLGHLKMSAVLTPPPDDTTHAKVNPKAWCLAAVGNIATSSQWRVVGRLGLCRWEDNFSGRHDTGYIEPDASDGTDLMFGGGLEYEWTPKLSLRVEWDRFRKVVHGKKDVDLFSAGFIFRF